MSHVASDFHDVRGYMNWNEHGDSPYWAIRKIADALGGGHSFDTTIDGGDVRVSLNNEKIGISPRSTDSVEEIYEYGVWWELENGLQFGGHLKPRFELDEFREKQPDVPFWDRDQITVPRNLVEGEDYDQVVTVLDMVLKGETSKRQAAKCLGTSRPTISRAIKGVEMYGQ